jgi:putative ATPase
MPLAELLRPHDLAEIIGQHHLLGPDKPLKIAFDTKKLHSMILWGPPGVGKTTLAKLTAKSFDCEWIALGKKSSMSSVSDLGEIPDLSFF